MNFRNLFAGAVAGTVFLAGSAFAAPADVMIPAGPGGGWDTTGRETLRALNDTGIFTDGANYTNKGGAAGTIGLAEFISNQEGNDNALIFNGSIMVGGIVLNNSPVTLDQTTPLARLTNEFLAIAVAADSPFQTLADFTAALKADPGAVAVGGGSAGGADHILLALIAKDQGADVTKINYIPQASGAETAAAVIGGSLAAGISGLSEFRTFVDSGRMRILAVSSEERLPNTDFPTLMEGGVNVTIGNWRGVSGAPGMSDEARQAWLDRLEQLHGTDEWKATLEKNGWADAYLAGDDFAAFIEEESDRMTAVLKDVGLVQ